jgi:hypothetical protein
VVEDETGFAVYSGYPLLRLWEDAVTGLFGTPDALPTLAPNWPKRGLDLRSSDYRFESQSLPLVAIYLLEHSAPVGVTTAIAGLSGSSALMALIANTGSNYLLDAPMRARELALVARLANRVPLRRMIPADAPTQVPELCAAILADLEQVLSANAKSGSDDPL